MQFRRRLALSLATVLTLVALHHSARGAINTTGSFYPADPQNWTHPWGAYVGYTADGSLTIDSDSDFTSYEACIGNSNFAGTASVAGTGSTWTNTSLYVGGYNGTGSGSLSITDGGRVITGTYNTSTLACLGSFSGSTGIGTVTGAGSQWIVNGYGSSDGQFSALTVGYKGTGVLDVADGGAITASGLLTIGSQDRANGTLHIYNGGTVSSGGACIGKWASTGSVSITGLGSTWINTNTLTVAQSHGGKGDLTISNHGNARCVGLRIGGYGDYHGTYLGGLGVVTVTGPGSTLINGASTPQAPIDIGPQGKLNIIGGATVTSISDYIRSSTVSGQWLGGYATVTGLGSKWINSELSVAGNLKIANGGEVSTTTAGISQGGRVALEDAGSKWTINDNINNYSPNFFVSGSLYVRKAASVVSRYGSMAYGSKVQVDGSGSAWSNSTYLEIDAGKLTLSSGANVSASGVWLKKGSNGNWSEFDIRKDSHLIIGGGSGTIQNDELVGLTVDPSATPGTRYAPISAGAWTGTGKYYGIGGTWDSTTHELVAAPIEQFASGQSISIDVRNTQRFVVRDSNSGWSFYQSYAEPGYPLSSGNYTRSLLATAVSGYSLTTLGNLLKPSESVLSAWQFSNAEPTQFYFDVGSGFSRENFRVWHSEYGAQWTEATPYDMVYDGRYLSFEILTFSSWAVSGIPVPEPTTLSMLFAFGALMLLAAGRRAAQHFRR